jgi:hypothetical protein
MKLFQPSETTFGILPHQAAFGGRLDAAASPREQRSAARLFKLTNPQRHGRLSDAQMVGSGTKTTQPTDRQESFQLF